MNSQEASVSKPKSRRSPVHDLVFDPTAEIVPPRHLKAVVGLAAITCWRLRRAGLFPAPIKLSVGRIGWEKSTLVQWLADRQAGR